MPGLNGAQTKRVSVLIGNHQPIGVAQTKRMSVLECARRVLAVTILMAVKNEDLTYKDIYKGIHDDENNAWSETGYHLFVISATCLVLVRDCHSRLSCLKHDLRIELFLMPFWLNAN